MFMRMHRINYEHKWTEYQMAKHFGRATHPAGLSLRQPETGRPGMRLQAGAAVPLPDLLHGREDGAHHRCAVGEMVLEGQLRSGCWPGLLCVPDIALITDQPGHERGAGSDQNWLQMSTMADS